MRGLQSAHRFLDELPVGSSNFEGNLLLPNVVGVDLLAGTANTGASGCWTIGRADEDDGDAGRA